MNDGLLLDGTGDYADVPYSRSIDPGSGDFKISLRFLYQATASTRNQVLFWGFGDNTWHLVTSDGPAPPWSCSSTTTGQAAPSQDR